MALQVITMNKRQVYILLRGTIAIQWLLTPSRGVLIPRLLMGVEFLHTNDTSSPCAFDATFYLGTIREGIETPIDIMLLYSRTKQQWMGALHTYLKHAW